MVKGKAVITFAQISIVPHVTLFHTPFASGSKVENVKEDGGHNILYVPVTHEQK